MTAQDAIGKPCCQIVQGSDECGVACTPNCGTQQALRGQRPIGNFDLMVRTPLGQKWCNISVLVTNTDPAGTQFALHIVHEVDFRKKIELLVQKFVRNELGSTTEQTSVMTHVNRSDLRDTSLSEREIEILKMIARGASTRSVGQDLYISPSTVNNHVQHILRKLNASNRLDAVRRAERSGLI